MTRSAAGSMRRLDDGPSNRPGRWQIRYHGRSRVVRGTRAAAAHELALMVATLAGRPPTEPVTLAEAVRARIDFLRPQRSPTTIAEYDRLLVKRVEPAALASKTIDRVTAGDLDDLYASFPSLGIARPVHRLIAASLAQAERRGWVDRNVAAHVHLQTPPRRRRTLPPFDRLAAALDDMDRAEPELGCLLRIAVATGMRRGEVVALQWRDVDLESGAIQVRRAAYRVDGKTGVKDTKTHAERVQHIGPATVTVIRAQLARQRAFLGGDPDPGSFLVPDRSGRLCLAPGMLTGAWKRLRARHGLAAVRLHDLRHLYGTSLLAAGFTIADVSEALGHASPAVTLAVYAHGTERTIEAGKVIEALMAGDDGTS